MSGFANVHPFFVHAPLVLIPLAALMVWLGRVIRKEGFDTASLLVVVAAALCALLAMASGLSTGVSFAHDAAATKLLEQHQINGVILAVVSSVAALLAVAEWRGLLGKRAWWLRAALLTWMAIGAFFSGHNGAQLVYQHGAAVAPAAVIAQSAAK